MAYAHVQSPPIERTPWQPGLVRRLPWYGLLSLAGVIATIIASVAILIASNGRPLDEWVFQPAVYLAITSAIANILLHFGLSQGVAITWWSRALKHRATVGDLHRSWAYGSSFFEALRSGRHFNYIACACILTTLVPINGPLLQRATQVVIATDQRPVTLKLQVGSDVPAEGTGYRSGRDTSATGTGLFTSRFGRMVQDWNNQSPIQAPVSDCRGTCSARVKGLGLAVNCSGYTVPYDINNTETADFTFIGVEVFRTDISWSGYSANNISLGFQYKASQACSGALQIRNCSLQTAIVSYPVLINGNDSTITLDPNSTVFDDQLVSITQRGNDAFPGPTPVGGIVLALRNRFFSILSIRWEGAVEYVVRSTGNTAAQYALVNDSDSTVAHNCTVAFSDPTNDVLAATRELMFRTAMLTANASTPVQQVAAIETHTQNIYESHYAYLAGAVVLMLASLLAVASTFYGYWHIGRKVSMSPVEIGKAFAAPVLRGGDSNASVGRLLRAFGGSKVRYGSTTGYEGVVSQGTHSREYVGTKMANERIEPLADDGAVLRIADEAVTELPVSGATYAG